jgi:hypothetical protein
MLFVQRALVNRLSPHFATIRWAIARGARLRSGHGYTLYGIYADGEPSCACLLSHRMLVLIENIHILRTIC